MNKSFIAASFFYLLFSCTSNNQYIEKDKFVEVLAYIHLAESAAEKSDTSLTIIKQTYLRYQNEIFQKYKIDSLQFKSSYDYYMKDPIQAQAFYDRIIEKTQKMQLE